MIISKKRAYSKEFKASVLEKLEPPTNDTPTSLSRELNIPRTTIYQWIRKTIRIRKIHIINLQINGLMKKKKKFMFQFLIGRLSTLLTIFLGIKKASTK